MNQLSDETLSTHDLAMSSALLALGHSLCEVDYSDSRRASFVFQSNPQITKAMEDYWDNKLLVNPRTYFNTLKDLKSRIYTQKMPNN